MAACPLVSPGLLVGFWRVHVATASPQPVVTVWPLYFAMSPLASAIEVMLNEYDIYDVDDLAANVGGVQVKDALSQYATNGGFLTGSVYSAQKRALALTRPSVA
eukprot:684974-Prymnesium_polylepis.1